MSPPIVVQGTPVGNPNRPTDQPTNRPTDQPTHTPSPTFTGNGEKQQSKCRDPIFALVRYVLNLNC
jgi:hypothetical protein